MKLKNEGKQQADWGMHAISVQRRLPEDLMSLTIPYELLAEINGYIDQRFVSTESWNEIWTRNKKIAI